MYNEHFGLRTNPFNPTPSPEFIFHSRELREALAHFRYALENREAFLLLTGEVGTGKTTAVQALLRHLPLGTPVAVVTHTTLEPRELIEEISLRFGLNPATGASKPSMVRALEEYFELQWHESRQAILILDEAHLLAPKVLEEVRLLSNLEREGGKLVQICLVGQPELVGHLQKNELRQLRQRISIRYALRPLSREETAEYLAHRLKAAGCPRPEDVFAPEASELIHALTFGIPREINVVGGQAMLNAFLAGLDQVQRKHVVSVREDYGFEGLNNPQTGPDVAGDSRGGSRPSPSPPPPVRFQDPEGMDAYPEDEGEADPGPPPGPRPTPRPIPLPPAELRPEPRDVAPPSSPAPPAMEFRESPASPPPDPPVKAPPARWAEPEAPAQPRGPVEAKPAPQASAAARAPARLTSGVGHAASKSRKGSGSRGTILFWVIFVALLGAAGGYFWWQTRGGGDATESVELRSGSAATESEASSPTPSPMGTATADSTGDGISAGDLAGAGAISLDPDSASLGRGMDPPAGDLPEDAAGVANEGATVSADATSPVAVSADNPVSADNAGDADPGTNPVVDATAVGQDGRSEAFPYRTLLDPSVEEEGFQDPITVQIASFRTEAMANRILSEVSGITKLSGVVLPAVVSGTTWYRILLGSFKDVPSAQEAVLPLLRRNIITEVVVKPVPTAWKEHLLNGAGR